MPLSIAAGHGRVSLDPVVADVMNCVDQDQPLGFGRRRRFLEHHPAAQVEHEQASAYFSVQRNGESNVPALVPSRGSPQEAAVGKHYTLFPEAAGLLNHAHREVQGDQYSCLTHEMVDLTGQAYDSPEDVLFLTCSGRTVSTGSTRLSLHPAAVLREHGGASSQQHRIQAEGGNSIMKEIADDLTLTLCTSARQTSHPSSTESERVTTLAIV